MDPNDTTDEEANSRFTDSPISRRQFARLSAATGATLALPGAASADVGDPAFDAEYEYVLTHTPAEHAVPTLVEFESAAGLEALDVGEDVRTTTVRA